MRIGRKAGNAAHHCAGGRTALLMPLGGVARAATLRKLDAIKEDQDVVRATGKASIKAILRDENGNEFAVKRDTVIFFEMDGPNTPEARWTRRHHAGPAVHDWRRQDEVHQAVFGHQRRNRRRLRVEVRYEPGRSRGRDHKTQPGTTPEPDFTDVVTRTFFDPVPGTLDCQPEKSVQDPGANHTITTCTLSSRLRDVRIDGENLGVANNPDAGRPNNKADFNDRCITGSDGSCTITISPTKAEAGSADICFWVVRRTTTASTRRFPASATAGCATASP